MAPCLGIWRPIDLHESNLPLRNIMIFKTITQQTKRTAVHFVHYGDLCFEFIMWQRWISTQSVRVWNILSGWRYSAQQLLKLRAGPDTDQTSDPTLCARSQYTTCNEYWKRLGRWSDTWNITNTETSFWKTSVDLQRDWKRVHSCETVRYLNGYSFTTWLEQQLPGQQKRG